MSAKLDPCLHVVEYTPHEMDATIVAFYRKRGEEAGVSNLKAGIEDGMALSGFQDNSVDVVTCTWGLESMPDHKTPLQVRISVNCCFHVTVTAVCPVVALWKCSVWSVTT